MSYKIIKFRVIQDIYWEAWGHYMKVFSKGQICYGELYKNGDIVAESPYHSGISDYISKDCIEILN